MATKKRHETKKPTILYRSETNKVIGGVCGGLGEVFDIDPTILRVLFLIAFFFGGSGFLLYIILWIVIPKESGVALSSDENIKENIEELKEKAQSFAEDFRVEKDNNKILVGIFLLFLGIVFLFNNFGIAPWFNLTKLWPVFLIILGFFVLTKKHDR